MDASAVTVVLRTAYSINQSFRLCVVHRQGGDSPDQVAFRNLLSHASRGGLTEEEWRILDSRSERKLNLESRD
ncbi:hypothetical protein GALMADRAFT_227302 [Galerina marginata CBS 339.88]|uniref:Uncharacterized protein n=1 Tax=Galerina marginata (strain CBS 339.88) TaxID=685588 RepID=A0A067SVS5_GALM3|nr:hypothetical protein GALMADRAFT_227302 [Galerina marginata CBS 339.88]